MAGYTVILYTTFTPKHLEKGVKGAFYVPLVQVELPKGSHREKPLDTALSTHLAMFTQLLYIYMEPEQDSPILAGNSPNSRFLIPFRIFLLYVQSELNNGNFQNSWNRNMVKEEGK